MFGGVNRNVNIKAAGQEIRCFYGIRKLVAMLKKSHHWALYFGGLIQFTSPKVLFLRSIRKIPLEIGLQNDTF
jgi:hypothetical protein